MKRRYVVQPVGGFDGLEFLADAPAGRRLYRAGEVVELDDTKHDIPGLLGWGIVRLEEPPEKPAKAGREE